MWYRPAAALGLLLALAAVCFSQNAQPYSRAVPPDRAALEKLNLRTEWSVYLPTSGGRDTLATIQTADDQLFVQTRTGSLTAIDARSGKVQWTAALGNGGYSNAYPVAVNSRYVFATNVTRLYSFHRYTGVTEFTSDLGSAPTAGVAADETGVYAVLSIRQGTSGAQRVVAFDIPHPIVIPAAGAAGNPADGSTRGANPVDELTRRYPSEGANRSNTRTDDFSQAGRPSSVREAPTGGLSGSRSPSLAVTPRVSPPYTLDGAPTSPSLNTLPTLRQPYHLRDDAYRNVQRTPSLGTIPPSVAAALALGDLRPRAVEPRVRWEYGANSRVVFAPVQSPLRVWLVTDARSFIALSKVDKTTEVAGPLWDRISAPPGQAGTIAYVPLGDGTLMAVDLTIGNKESGLNSPWRTNVGGIVNRAPVVTADAVYAAGDNSGVARVDRATGDVLWRTDRAADRVLAVNQEFVYVRDRQGRVLVFDARRATDPATGRAAPLATLDFPEFNVPVVNTVSDRLYLAADNGLLVCLRDASAKYAAPVRMAPDVSVNLSSAAGAEGFKPTPAPADAPKDAMPKDAAPKEPAPKEPTPKEPAPKEPVPKDAAPPAKKVD